MNNGMALQTTLMEEVWDFTDLVLRTRFAAALEKGISRYAIYRELRIAARAELDQLFDDLALNLDCAVQRLDSRSMLLDRDRVFVAARGVRKSDYCSCAFDIWAATSSDAEQIKDSILARIGAARILEPMFSIDWHFLTSKDELESATIEEMADDRLYDEGYPALSGGVARFIRDYLAADETVLVLQGPPGTGKTRLIRAILGEMSRRKDGKKAHALYTGDTKALETDEIFVRFITGWEDAFVVEDADHLLRPRAEGNEHLHRFLTIADGVVRAQNRKIIFSTNLPNVGDLDDAIVRPGRCFARLYLKELEIDEARRLVGKLCGEDAARAATAIAALETDGKRRHSLADIYKAVATASGA